MLKFTHLFNFGLAGALIVPSVTQQMDTPERIEESIRTTDLALATLADIGAELEAGNYEAVRRIVAASEAPLGGARERDILLDRLRNEIGMLSARVERIDGAPVLPHLKADPTEDIDLDDPASVTTSVATTGLNDQGRNELGHIWPPVIGGAPDQVRTEDDRFTFEAPGFTVDAVRQGRAYYRAGRYNEALTLLRTREGEPTADYWIGRTHERMGGSREAMAAYTAVMNNPDATPVQVDRAKQDRDFLQWLIDFDRKVKDMRADKGGVK